MFPGSAKPAFKDVLASVPEKDIVTRSGIKFYHARRIVKLMGLRTWESHLWEKVPKCISNFNWKKHVDYMHENSNKRGVPSYWLSEAAARQIYDKHA